MRPSFDLLKERWIPCERPDGSLVFLGLEETLLGAHELAAVHDSSPLVTVALHRLLLAILHRAFGPTSRGEWVALWKAPRFPPKSLRAYLQCQRGRFDLFHPERPFLQVAHLPMILAKESKAPLATPAWRLAPEHSQHSAAAHLYAPLPSDPAITPSEAARSLLVFLGYTAGGRIQNDAASRKAGILRGGAVVLVQGTTLRETLIMNLVWSAKRSAKDLPPWERGTTRRTNRAPLGPVDMLAWPSRRVLLLPDQSTDRGLVVRNVITAAGEDMDGACPDPMFAYVKREDPAPVPVKIDPNRATWRDALALFDPATGAGGFRRPAACAQLADLVSEDVVSFTTPVHVELLGLAGGGAGRAAAIRDWRADRLPLPLSLLVSGARVETLRRALSEAEDIATALRQRVLYAMAVTLIPDPHRDIIAGLRENLGTLPGYWHALGLRFPAWLESLGAAPGTAEELDACLWAWRGALREVAGEVVLHAIEDVGMGGRAMRAGAAAERALELALAELIPLPEGISPERLPLPFHAPPAWTDSTGFVPALDELIKEGDLGALAALRMSLQVVPAGIAPEARAYVEPLLPPQASRRVRQVYFLVAALRAVHRDQDRGVSLGRAMRRIHEALGDRLDRAGGTAASERFEALLAAHPNEVGTLVSAALPLVYEHGALDWERLLHDLIFWTRRDRLVQRALARDFYATPSVPPTPVEVP